MPTDETTLEALAAKHEALATHFTARANQSFDAAEVAQYLAHAAEARLIADALRFRLAALTAPAARGEAVAKDIEGIARQLDALPLNHPSVKALRAIAKMLRGWQPIQSSHAAEIAALKADGERLDWLDVSGESLFWDARLGWHATNSDGEEMAGPDGKVRDAIDAARASEPRGRE